MHQLGFGGFQIPGDDVSLDQLRHLGTDHVRAEQLSGLSIEYCLDHALGLTERNGFAVADIGKASDLHFMSGFFGGCFGEPDARDLRPAVGAAGNPGDVQRVDTLYPCDPLDAQDALVARLVGQPRRPDHVTDCVDTVLAGAQPLFDVDVAAVELYLRVLAAAILDVGGASDSEDPAINCDSLRFVAGDDLGGNTVAAGLYLPDFGARTDLDTLLLDGLAG